MNFELKNYKFFWGKITFFHLFFLFPSLFFPYTFLIKSFINIDQYNHACSACFFIHLNEDYQMMI